MCSSPWGCHTQARVGQFHLSQVTDFSSRCGYTASQPPVPSPANLDTGWPGLSARSLVSDWRSQSLTSSYTTDSATWRFHSADSRTRGRTTRQSLTPQRRMHGDIRTSLHNLSVRQEVGVSSSAASSRRPAFDNPLRLPQAPRPPAGPSPITLRKTQSPDCNIFFSLGAFRPRATHPHRSGLRSSPTPSPGRRRHRRAQGAYRS